MKCTTCSMEFEYDDLHHNRNVFEVYLEILQWKTALILRSSVPKT